MAIVPAFGAWDPAGLSEGMDVGGDAEARERRATFAHGTAAFGVALEKVTPETFTTYQWIGSTGAGINSGQRDIYRTVPHGERDKPKEGKKDAVQQHKGTKKSTLFNPKEFSWKRLLHPMYGDLMGSHDGGILTETPFTPTTLRLYTDHRVMGQIVVPGVSHCAYFAATAISGLPPTGRAGKADEECGLVKEVLFERPFMVHRGFEILTNRGHGDDLDHSMPVVHGFGAGDETGGIVTYCRSGHVSRVFKSPKMDIFTGAADH